MNRMKAFAIGALIGATLGVCAEVVFEYYFLGVKVYSSSTSKKKPAVKAQVIEPGTYPLEKCH